MRRLRFFFLLTLPMTATTSLAAVGLALSACSSQTAGPDPRVSEVDEDGGVRRDGGPVAVPDASSADAGEDLRNPSCSTYCNLVMDACTGANAQYRSRTECIRFCALFETGTASETDTNTLGCRQYYAGTPSKSNADSYCNAAGPYGGNVCGDRCTAFCQMVTTVCSVEAGAPPNDVPYPSYPDCQTACSGIAYTDGGTADGGYDGSDAFGPESGDTLNCRLFHFREAVVSGMGCGDLGTSSNVCR